MGDDDPKKQHALYGSAGMAASGMMPGARKKRKKPDSEEATPPPPLPEEPPAEEPANQGPASDEPAEAAPVEEAEVSLPPEVSLRSDIEEEPEVPPAEEEPEIDEEAESPASEETAPSSLLRAAILGQTGAGDFGNRFDVVFRGLEGVETVALSDANSDALESARSRAEASTGYADYREMLETESPDLVCVAPRWTDQRRDMIRASLEAGAHVLCEAPFCETLRDADELVALANEKNRKIAVAHPMRCDPHVLQFHAESEQLIGELLEIRLFGSMDNRSGGEDLLLYGSHLFDLARLFAGDPSYCTATVTEEGIPAIAEDAHEAESDRLGLIVGDTVRAEFRMESGIHVSFVSDPRLRNVTGPWGAEFIGSKGRMRLFANLPPVFSLLANSNPGSHSRADTWQLWPRSQGPYHAPVDKLTKVEAANRLVVKDWLTSIEEDRAPANSGENALKALEMVHGVWQAAVTMKRAYFPLTQRLHPLSEEAN